MQNSDPSELGVSALADAYASRVLSPVEVTQAILRRIERNDDRINAFAFLAPEDALAAAHDSEARWHTGKSLGALDGIPVTIKDFFSVRGWPTRRGSRVLAAASADAQDAPAVARLREAGAILLGKTTTTEFGHKASGQSPLTGVTHNPWNPQWTSGGSSCGAAAAAAAGFGPLHLGSDAAGSIRIPASFCGVYGHKPTSGLVPAYPMSASGHLAVQGPIARRVDDAAAMLRTISSPDRRDWRALPSGAVDLQPLSIAPTDLRLALATGVNDCNATGDVADRLMAVARTLQGAGAVVEEVDLSIPRLLEQFLTIWNVFVATSARDFSIEQLETIDPSMREMVKRGQRVSGVELNAAQLFMFDVGSTLSALFERFDALLLPTLPFPAFGAEDEHPGPTPVSGWLAWAQTCFVFNATSLPASSVPCGFSSDGRPIGVQVVGPVFSDARVMAISRLIELSLSTPTLAAPRN